jgi:hypothetical protein
LSYVDLGIILWPIVEYAIAVVEIRGLDCSVEIARNGLGEAGKAHADADDEYLSSIEVSNLNDNVEVVRATGGHRMAECRTGRAVRFVYFADGLSPIEADVAFLQTLAGRWEVYAADTDVQNFLVTHALLAVVLRVEVVNEKDRLVVLTAGVDSYFSEEDYAVTTGEVFGFELLDRIYVYRSVIVTEVLSFSRSDFIALKGSVFVVCGVFSGDEVHLEVAGSGEH